MYGKKCGLHHYIGGGIMRDDNEFMLKDMRHMDAAEKKEEWRRLQCDIERTDAKVKKWIDSIGQCGKK